ncbi:MAG: endonuclease/exonuclease/phosphatase family protein [Magnetospirillum sp.]|nr:endonuclease/exonuclease/phosphatase family protein [Magnetospirillum sp.]
MRRWRLGTFNLENLDDRGGEDRAFEDRVAVLRPQLRRLRADVLCLQEVNAHTIDGKRGPRTPVGLDRLLEGTDYARYHRLISTNRGGSRPSDHHNLVILSRFPILSHGQVWHHLVPPPAILPVTARPAPEQAQPVEWDRPILHACLDLGRGRVVQVVNVHLRAPRAAWLPGQKTEHGRWLSVGGWAEGFYLAAVKRAGQALEARLLVESLFDADPQARVVVCGDFNCGDREAPLRTLMGDEEDTGNGHLAPRMLVPAERSVSDSQRYSVIHHGRRVMLDHLLLSRPLLGDLVGCEIHNESLGDELVSPARIWQAPDSYHAPLVAEFT